MYSDLTAAKVLADSTYQNGTRLITLEAVFPRFILAEVNTHRALSRNSASSRAIPVAKQIAKVMESPFVPQRFPVNQPGMSASAYWEPGSSEYDGATYFWLAARNAAVNQVQSLVNIQDVHKQIASRLLEPFMWHTAIISATEPAWDAVFALRCQPDAQPEFQKLANCIRDEIALSTPTQLSIDGWHLPLIGFPGDEELSLIQKIKVSVGRIARVSHLTHDGVRDIDADLGLFQRLQESKHLSPFEHVATPTLLRPYQANFRGWRQVRHFVEVGAFLPAHETGLGLVAR